MLLTRYRPAAPSQSLPFSTTYTTPGTQTVAIPSGATSVTVECYGAGAGPNGNANAGSGGGGAYSARNTYSVSGLTGLYLSVPAGGVANATGQAGGDCFVKENTAAGTTICLAKGGGSGGTLRIGGAAASGVGDVKFSGGNGEVYGGVLEGGGGGAGPSGNGGNGSGGSGGTAGGGLAGAGGEWAVDAAPAGGGGGCRDDAIAGNGARGAIKLSWS